MNNEPNKTYFYNILTLFDTPTTLDELLSPKSRTVTLAIFNGLGSVSYLTDSDGKCDISMLWPRSCLNVVVVVLGWVSGVW